MFQTPLGLSRTMEDAKEICEQNDILPNRGIVPVPVAITEAGDWEVCQFVSG